MIRLEDVNEGNWRIPLAVSDEQKQYVASSTTILARAYAYRNARSRAYIIYNDDTPIGMGLYHDAPEFDAYIFSELFIDERYHGKGYGKEALYLAQKLAIEIWGTKCLYLGTKEANLRAQSIYKATGFVADMPDPCTQFHMGVEEYVLNCVKFRKK